MTADEQPPAPGWWKAPDGGWHPPTEPAGDAPDGTAEAKATSSGVGCLVAIGIIVALGVIISLLGGGNGGDDNEPDLEHGAFDVCTQFVTDRLKAPSTATFRNYFQDDGEVTVTNVGETYTVVSSVDSENGFGAKIRSRFVCKVRHVEGTNWRLVDISIV